VGDVAPLSFSTLSGQFNVLRNFIGN